MSHRSLFPALALLVAYACPLSVRADAAPTSAAQRCGSLTGISSDGLVITFAAQQPADLPVPGATAVRPDGDPTTARQVAGLPAFCRVAGSIQAELGSDIRFEVWLPEDHWDGRFNGGNNGGFAGSVAYVDLAQAVLAGQVGASTDTGHQASPAETGWAHGRPERIRDFGWRAIHLTAVTAKQLIERYYGRGPDHSYFLGCSNGGRQGLMEASRFPEDYDGIVAGAPASSSIDMVMAFCSTVQAQLPVGAALRPSQMPLLQAEVLRQCDAADGQADGLVADPRRCHPDLTKLACGVSDSRECFTSAQIAALEVIHKGRVAAPDVKVYGFLPSGGEVGAPIASLGWETWITWDQFIPTIHWLFANNVLQDMVSSPIATPETFDFDTSRIRLKAEVGPELDPEPNLQRFFDRGGKLIVWHGWADAAVSPLLTLDYYQTILHESGSKSADAARLFMVPGVQHCANGPGPDLLGQFGAPTADKSPQRSLGAAVQAWVESARVPETLTAGYGYAASNLDPAATSKRERLVCAYPRQATLRQGEDPDVGSSYECRDQTD